MKQCVKVAAMVLMLSAPVQAQPRPVREWADWASYGTAMANPAGALQAALAGDHKACDLGRLAIREVVGNTATIGLKHWRYGEPDAVRPCLGCAPDGDPSGHTANGIIGSSTAWSGLHGWVRWVVVASTAAATGLLRHDSFRHFWEQIGKGALVGVGAEASGYLLRCKE